MSMFRDLSKSLIARGVLSVALGIVAIGWPNITVGAFVIVFAIYAFVDAFTQGGIAFACLRRAKGRHPYRAGRARIRDRSSACW